MQDIIQWLNDKSNRKLISYILIISGISSIASGVWGFLFIEANGFSQEGYLNYAIGWIWTAIFSFVLGAIFLILGVRLFRSAK